jgi:two-component system, LytTR family, sensor histidine kinase LytS
MQIKTIRGILFVVSNTNGVDHLALLLLRLAQEIALFVAVAFAMGRSGLFQAFFARLLGWRDKALLALGGGLLGVIGTFAGIPVQGALANSRVIGPMVAGLYGGPLAGLAAGLIAGLHRTSMGGFTAVACGISTVTEGLLGGMIHRWRKGRSPSAPLAAAATVVAEVLQMAIILLVARPFSEALGLVREIAVPMTLANAAGVGLMVAIIQDAQEQRERIAARQAHQALKIAGRTLPHLREGLTVGSAGAASRIILNETQLLAVSITDLSHILGFSGVGSDHHRSGERPLTQATWDVLADGSPRVISSSANVGCTHPDCPLTTGVVVPLKSGEQVVGTLHLYQKGPGPVSPVTVELAVGLGQLLSYQIELSRVHEMGRLVAQAEVRALHAQINPHFLFNALTTISALCRREPDRARDLLVMLSQYLRSSIRAAEGMVTLGQELEFVEAYLAIEKARYGERLHSDVDVPQELLELPVPIMALQPLVENSVRHGLMPRAAGGSVRVSARLDAADLILRVEDDGVGIGQAARDGSSGNGVALKNVSERLRHLYGSGGLLSLTAAPGGGTVAQVRLPVRAAVVTQGGMES